MDDFAHNPAKIAASIRACQPMVETGGKVLAWFQPHGFGPTRFLRKELVEETQAALRPEDKMFMSEIYYAGGTVTRDISAADLIQDLQNLNVQAAFVEQRSDCFQAMLQASQPGDVLLLMGARDPSLADFSRNCWEELSAL